MGRKYAKYTKEFREHALHRLGEAASVSALCRELGVSRQLLYQWRETAERERQERSEAVQRRLSKENAQLKKLLVKRSLEADFFKGAFEKVEALRRTSTGSGATASTPRSGR
jgi:transposase-like protein